MTKTFSTLSIAATILFLSACASLPENAGEVNILRAQYNKLAANPQTIELAPAAFLDAERALLRAESLVKSKESAERIELQIDTVKQNLSTVEKRLAGEDENAVSSAENQGAGGAVAKSSAQSRAQELATYMAIKAEEFQEETSGISSKLTNRGLVLTINDVLFEMGKTKLTSSSVNGLRRVSEFLASFPDQKISVEGHTDEIGEEDFNQRISERRASSVKSALESHGIDPNRIKARGYGETRPVATSKTAEGRQQNRRVEIVVEISKK